MPGVELQWDLLERGSKRTYYIDTPTKIWPIHSKMKRGRWENRPWSLIPEWPEIGSPDGMTIDAAGKLWVAMRHGGSVLRIDPLSGDLLGQLIFHKNNVPRFWRAESRSPVRNDWFARPWRKRMRMVFVVDGLGVRCSLLPTESDLFPLCLELVTKTMKSSYLLLLLASLVFHAGEFSSDFKNTHDVFGWAKSIGLIRWRTGSFGMVDRMRQRRRPQRPLLAYGLNSMIRLRLFFRPVGGGKRVRRICRSRSGNLGTTGRLLMG